MSFQAKAPGSLMLFGEYAVLYGKKAVVTAIDKYITVTLTPRKDNKLVIHSGLGDYQTTLDDLKIESPFEFILASLLLFKDTLTRGCDIKVESEFAADLGLGSSAAVTVAMCRCLTEWLNPHMELLNTAKDVIQHVQGRGSGADAAASIYGGVIAYQMQDGKIERLTDHIPMHVFYSGKKLKTSEALKKIKQIDDSIINNINTATESAIQAIKQNRIDDLNHIAGSAQKALVELGVCTPIINKLIQWIDTQAPGSQAKISGSGFGDCVIAFSAAKMNNAKLPETLLSAGVKTLSVFNGKSE